MSESFKPIVNTPPNSWFGRMLFYVRLVLDFQNNTIYKQLKQSMPAFEGTVLDIGCGQSPYRHLLNKTKTVYIGLDIEDSKKFDYDNSEIIHYNGEKIPLKNNSVDCIICTEVLEHIVDPSIIISEKYRVLKKGGEAIVTIPWSARFHYIPYDFHRYTPSMLKLLFKSFKSVQITPRGTDVTAIVSKIIVRYFSVLTRINLSSIFFLPVCILLSPLMCFAIVIGHLSLIFKLGSNDDPLGYTVIVRK